LLILLRRSPLSARRILRQHLPEPLGVLVERLP
jgi:hypothetical protein